MTLLRVDGRAGTISLPMGMFPCSVGRSGTVAASAKREGDGATPIGTWPIRGALLRPDRLQPPRTRLPWRWLRPSDGWSDDPADPAYNQPARHPHRFSAEQLWRADALYDLILPLGYNGDPPVSGLGSAIFFHVKPESGVTEGCIAIALQALIDLLERLVPGDAVVIS